MYRIKLLLRDNFAGIKLVYLPQVFLCAVFYDSKIFI